MTTAEKGRSGTREWVFQRSSNLMICVWGAVFVIQLLMLEQVGYAEWVAVFEPMWFKIFSTIVLTFIALNSILAGWQIGTDYVKVAGLNKLYMLVCVVGSLAYFAAGVFILWMM